MKQAVQLVTVSLLCFSFFSLNAQVSGTAFRDYNFNGTQQTSGFLIEPGAYGIQVKAFNANGVQLGTTKTTSAGGAYSFSAVEIPAGTPVRIEFINPSGLLPKRVQVPMAPIFSL
ncbi:MAG: hypothetical protein K2X48_09480 [Chitinophagaceae bacterium]|nr:hypothetical protein [Chitinophagaceae bacterium]